MFSIELVKSYYITKAAGLVFKFYDKDVNADMETTGELKSQLFIASLSNAEINCIDVGANVGNWSAALVSAKVKGRIIIIDQLAKNLLITHEKFTKIGFVNFDLLRIVCKIRLA